MSYRKVIVITAGAFIVPLALLALGAAMRGNLASLLVELGLLMSNWLYMSAPHLLVVFYAAASRSARQFFLPWALIALSLELAAFQCWVWWWVPHRESGLAWVLYLPLSAIVLTSVAVIASWRQRSNPSFNGTPGGAL